MELFIIRHGQSQNNALADSALREQDPPLTETGHKQAQRVAAHLETGEEYQIEKLYTSGMLRALQTAAPIGRALGLFPEVWLDVHEQGGIWLEEAEGPRGYSGLTRAEMETRFPHYALPEGVTEKGWWNRPKETLEESRRRASRVAAALRAMASNGEKSLAVVTHGGFANILIQALLSSHGLDEVHFGHHNTAISRFSFVDGLLRSRYLNRVEHLSADMRT